MQIPEFEVGLDTLITAAGREPIVVMCAEAVPWRCHRSLIAQVANKIRPIKGMSAFIVAAPHMDLRLAAWHLIWTHFLVCIVRSGWAR